MHAYCTIRVRYTYFLFITTLISFMPQCVQCIHKTRDKSQSNAYIYTNTSRIYDIYKYYCINCTTNLFQG